MCVILHMSIITQYGRSALTLAAMWGETEVVVQLVKAGANVDMQDNVCQYIHFNVHVHFVHVLYTYMLVHLEYVHNMK